MVLTLWSESQTLPAGISGVLAFHEFVSARGYGCFAQARLCCAQAIWERIGMADGDRDTRQAMWRGWRMRCPACGEGSLMARYLKIDHECPNCGTELYHQRADDGPAWATILITGHLLAPAMLIVFEVWRPEGWKMAIGFSLFFVSLSLYLLPRIKGVFVGIQWAKRMHGFGGEPDVAPGA
jgi:uncharacterized protein (DUF983 family)